MQRWGNRAIHRRSQSSVERLVKKNGDHHLPAKSCGRTCREISSALWPIVVGPRLVRKQPYSPIVLRRRGRENLTRRDWFSARVRASLIRTLTVRLRSRRRCGSMRTQRRHATKYRSGTPRLPIYDPDRRPVLRSRTIIPEPSETAVSLTSQPPRHDHEEDFRSGVL